MITNQISQECINISDKENNFQNKQIIILFFYCIYPQIKYLIIEISVEGNLILGWLLILSWVCLSLWGEQRLSSNLFQPPGPVLREQKGRLALKILAATVGKNHLMDEKQLF
jgi:hypothetical protein